MQEGKGGGRNKIGETSNGKEKRWSRSKKTSDADAKGT